MRKVWFALKNRPSIADVIDRLKAGTRVWDLRTEVSHALGLDPDKFLPNYHRVEHHRAHISSAFYASPFEESAVLSLDGFGDFVSAMWGVGRGTKLDIHDWVEFPHSLGVLYTAITQYLGLPKFGDEYKTMALAAYGSPSHMDRLRDIVAITEPMGYRLDLSYFSHASNVSTMQWREGEPVLDTLFSEKLVRAFGQPPRQRETRRRHMPPKSAQHDLFIPPCLAASGWPAPALPPRKVKVPAGPEESRQEQSGSWPPGGDRTSSTWELYERTKIEEAANPCPPCGGFGLIHRHHPVPRDGASARCLWAPEFNHHHDELLSRFQRVN